MVGLTTVRYWLKSNTSLSVVIKTNILQLTQVVRTLAMTSSVFTQHDAEV